MSKTLKMVAAASMLMVPALAVAGTQENNYANCTKNADGSGSCNGNFLSFRNHPDPSTRVYFIESFSRYFTAYFPGAGNMTCYPNATVSAQWDRAMQHDGYFSISWDASGTCYHLTLNHGSPHANF